METSDSEYFESADEDFGTDQDDLMRKKDTNVLYSDSVGKFTSRNIPAKSDNVHVEHTDQQESRESYVQVQKCSAISNINARTTKKSCGKKLGQKLGTKLIDTYTDNNIQIDDNKVPNVLEGTRQSKMQIEEIKRLSDVEHTEELLKNEASEIHKKELSNDEDLWDESEFDWGNIENKEIVSEDLSKTFKEACSTTESNEYNRIEGNKLEIGDFVEVSNKKSAMDASGENSEKEENDSGWGDWGGWNVSSILSTATHSVSTITNHVSQGFNTVLETGIGIPSPEEMARISAMEEKIKNEEYQEQLQNDQQNHNFPMTFGLGNFVSGVSQLTKLVETTGTKVISGGLGTLETIGKKTMEVLQEGDPGLKKKRAFLQINQDKPILSQILREAKEKAEAENNRSFEEQLTTSKNYEAYFDDHQGLVHLEALELLSKQCSIKLQTILDSSVGNDLAELQETLDQIKELCELPDEDEDEQLTLSDIREKLESAVVDIAVSISYEKLLANWEETDMWLNNLKLSICNESELHQQAIETLAQLTALAVEQFHKAGELLLIKEHRSTADEADSLVQLTSTLTSFIGIVAAKFSDKLNSKAASISKENTANSLITNVFFEAGNSSTYIQDAFQLLIPVLQVGAI